jgi:hypothetical protein
MGSLAVIVVVIWLLRYSRGRSPSIMQKVWSVIIKGAVLIFVLALVPTIGAAAVLAPMALLPPIMALCFPSLVLDGILVPLRAPRCAYWTARIFQPLSFVGESVAGGVIVGVQASAKTGKRAQTIEWLRKRFNDAAVLRGGGVVAAGMLAAARGDRYRARALLAIADSLPTNLISRRVRAMARDGLVADAAMAGDWREVILLGRRRRQTLRWSYVVACCAERLIADPQAKPNWRLWLAWMIAPRRRATLPLLRRALAVPRRAKTPLEAMPSEPNLAEALAAFARVCAVTQANDGASLARAVKGLNVALSQRATRELIKQRLDALGAKQDADAITARFQLSIVDALAIVIEGAPHLAGEGSEEPMVAEAVARVRGRLFRDISAQCRDYAARAQSEQALDRLAEWEVWAALRHSADRLLRLDPSAETSMFAAMWPVCNNFAVFQHNAFKRLTLAYEIYSWMHRHAKGSPSAEPLLFRNMKASAAGG